MSLHISSQQYSPRIHLMGIFYWEGIKCEICWLTKSNWPDTLSTNYRRPDIKQTDFIQTIFEPSTVNCFSNLNFVLALHTFWIKYFVQYFSLNLWLRTASTLHQWWVGDHLLLLLYNWELEVLHHLTVVVVLSTRCHFHFNFMLSNKSSFYCSLWNSTLGTYLIVE